ncbi:MAG TPA: cation:proton antiporter [Phycisphaerales bacterium]|nr:cation:proton antiporter [Phycisphaerales bacterium]
MHNLPLLTTIAAAFAAAWVLGIITQKLRLSPIVGYLLAGVVIGPYTPGYVGDVDLATQLAEVGVILLMFGVGLHFHLKDLLAVKGIAVPGAVVQSLGATAAAVVMFYFLDLPFRTGLVIGMAMSVASTVVLLRVLMDKHMLSSAPGHAAVGWLIVEDIFTVLALVMVPMIAAIGGGVELPQAAQSAAPVVPELPVGATALEQARHAYEVAKAALHSLEAEASATHSSGAAGWKGMAWALGKLVALVAIVLLAGSKVVPWMLIRVAKLRSRELFTLTVLVLSVAIAVASAVFFGVSVALGAFLAGMVVAQSPVSHQAAADALPMRDAFSVLFFVAVGMLFDPMFLVERPGMIAAGLGIVMIVKPLTALMIVAVLGYPVRTGLVVALALAQIGEFSFILSQAARENGLILPEHHSLLVACAIISITLNPLIFGRLEVVEGWLKRRPRLWRLLNARAQRRIDAVNIGSAEQKAKREAEENPKPLAVIVGYGPVGRLVDAVLRDSGMDTCIIDMNMDTVQQLHRQGRMAIYGDAGLRDVLVQAGVDRAVHLVVTLPHSDERVAIVMTAKDINPKLEVTVRARYLREKEDLKHAGASKAVFEEGEAGLALAEHVMMRRGIDEPTREKLMGAVRKLWGMA